MTPRRTSDGQAGAAPARVYLPQRQDGQRFKIGWAVDPMVQVKRLPEHTADELDLQASHADTPDADSAIFVRAQDVLWVMEELLLRAGALNPVLVEGQGEQQQIRLVNVRGPRARLDDSLRWALLDLYTYSWSSGARSGSFVQLMEYDDNDLLLHMAAPRTVRRWAGGALTWPVQVLLERLRSLATYNRLAAGLSCRIGGQP